ncbi:hypothetical protein rerp_37420 [Rhodococcus erythropolis]|nr:hypothetical protein rerp_37420 [Rhodococcus erythropolis]
MEGIPLRIRKNWYLSTDQTRDSSVVQEDFCTTEFRSVGVSELLIPAQGSPSDLTVYEAAEAEQSGGRDDHA